MTLNDTFAFQLSAVGIAYHREYKAIPDRKFAFDFYIPKRKLLIELQGGTWMQRGGHNTGRGIQRDVEKVNLATLNEYAIMQFTTQDVEDGTAIDMVKKYLGMQEIEEAVRRVRTFTIIKTGQSVEKETCSWIQEDDPDICYWKTGCGNSFYFTEGTPTDNNMKYCCYCGKLLKQED